MIVNLGPFAGLIWPAYAISLLGLMAATALGTASGHPSNADSVATELIDGIHAARAILCDVQTSSSARMSASIIASLWAGEGVKRNLSVPRGTVG